MSNGWIKLHRQFRESPYYRIGAAMQTWIECLLRASHDERDVFLRRERMTLQPGQFVMGREEFGAAIGISGSTAWYWMLQFEADSMVDIKKTAKGSIVSVKNWGEYQNLTAELATNEQQKNTNKNVKKVKNERTKETSSTKKGPRPSVEMVIKAMEETFGTLDDTQANNRRYAWLLIQKAKKNRQGSTEEEAADGCVDLVRAIRGDKFWGDKVKKVETIFRNAERIASDIRKNCESQAVFIS